MCPAIDHHPTDTVTEALAAAAGWVAAPAGPDHPSNSAAAAAPIVTSRRISSPEQGETES